MDIYYIDRNTGKKEKEVVAGDRFLRWLHDRKSGATALELLIKRKWFSTLYGKMQDQPFSRKKIAKFVSDLSIDLTEADRKSIGDYRHFNDFFTRKLKKEARPICEALDAFASPADGRLLAYADIDQDKMIQVKGMNYTLKALFQDEDLAKGYHGGSCIVIRLNPSDYHRFHFPDGGIPHEYTAIKGQYYSVNPIALNRIAEVYCQNKRELTLFQSDEFGQIAYFEVGATCVGSIIQTYQPKQRVEKGDEKGYFKFGGSTVILLMEKGHIKIDEDIINNTNRGFETKVNMGEKIGGKANFLLTEI
ncbi:phosphatidylserine decarboxylase [Alkaliphilus metalliredigens QYMF]|uniref:Phosphatidylserine decarboxylase proenzyme n=1 Tax=Alkaliphilus metalliredigens (strain QYMF) TaxID=293826 RepID=A6TVR0_ALKMQ|nr:phosphatidylserine decarboxylase [Alkaliphilus metalliredigens]ABR50278.1 phosphatidylserine decarboxylase [Alkaliphilus metalliredigens QYMF]